MMPPHSLDTMLRPIVLWPAAWLRWLGGGLLLVGLLLPWGVIAWRTRQAVDISGTAAAGAGAALRPEMVLLPTGTFLMGSPADEPGRQADEAQRQVEITRPFAMAVTEVTQARYQQVMQALPASPASACRPAAEGADLPVVCLTWFEALAYCNRLSELEELTPCYRLDSAQPAWDDAACEGYRLPTEAEWEYAARAGSTQRYAGTDAEDDVCRYANVLDQSAPASVQTPGFACHDGYTTVALVRRRLPQAWLLYDLTGNVAEWVWDAVATDRVVRGGSWQSFRAARNAARTMQPPSRRAPEVGLRVVRSFPLDPSTR